MTRQTCPRPGAVKLALTAYCDVMVIIDPEADRARMETSTPGATYDHTEGIDIDGAWTLVVGKSPTRARRPRRASAASNVHIGTNSGVLVQIAGDFHGDLSEAAYSDSPEGAPDKCLITLPAGSEILADVEHGDLMLKGEVAKADVMVSHGDFTASKVTDLRANISHGTTYVGTRPSGKVVIYTFHGNARVTCRTKDTLQVVSNHGDIDIRFPSTQKPKSYRARANPGTLNEH